MTQIKTIYIALLLAVLHSWTGALAEDPVSLHVVQIRQETNLCVPTSAAMVLAFYGQPHSPREIKTWSRGHEYNPSQPFTDFTATYYNDLLSGLRNHGITWTDQIFSNDDSGFQTGLEEIEIQIDDGHPVLVDTDLYSLGHTFVLSGYDLTNEAVIAVDPFATAPGMSEISFEDFKAIWNASKTGSNHRAAIFTTAPDSQ